MLMSRVSQAPGVSAPTETVEETSALGVRRPSGRPPRIAIYSHDTFGLGHLRRNLLLAGALSKAGGDAEILLVTGSPRALSYPTLPRLSVVELPYVTKDAAGHYVPRHAGIPIDDVVRMRKGIIRDAILRFAPDVLLVDHAPLGLRGELLPLLGDLHHFTSCRLVLGLRDILDEPERVVADWRENGTYRVLDGLYHHLWVYGARDVFSLADLYRLPPSMAARLEYLGYLGREAPIAGAPPCAASRDFPDRARPHLLCLVGGGEDGFPVADCFLRMLAAEQNGYNGTLVTGPFLPREQRNQLASLAAPLPHVRILRFTSDLEPLLTESDLVITMGGYNSVLEALSAGRRTIVVPRVFPRREQWLRANAFERRGLLRMIEPGALAPRALLDAAAASLAGQAPVAPEDAGVAWNGVARFAAEMRGLLRDQALGREEAHVQRRLLRA